MLYLCCFSCIALWIHDEHFCRCVFTTDKFLLKCALKKKKMWSASLKKGVALAAVTFKEKSNRFFLKIFQDICSQVS